MFAIAGIEPHKKISPTKILKVVKSGLEPRPQACEAIKGTTATKVITGDSESLFAIRVFTPYWHTLIQ